MTSPSENKREGYYSITQGYFEQAWKVFAKHWQILIILVAIPLVLDLLLLATIFSDVRLNIYSLDDNSTFTDIINNLPASFLPYSLITLFVGILMGSAVLTTLILLFRGKAEPSVGQAIANGLSRFWDLFLISITVGLLVILGLAAFVVPGLIIGFLLMYSVHVRIDQKLSVSDSLKRSYQMASNNWQLSLFMLLGLVAVAFAFSLLSQLMAAPFEGFAKNSIFTLMTIPLSAFISVVFTKFYFVLKKKPKSKSQDS